MSAWAQRWARIDLADVTSVLAGLAGVAIFLLWFQKGAGYNVTVWVPGAVLILGLLATVVLASGGVLALSRAQATALVSLGCFAAWSYASISWADLKSDAWDGANRNLLYFATFALFLLLPWTPRAANLVLTTYAGATTVLAAAAVVHVSTSADDELFIRGRFAYPTGYPNATVAVLLMAAFIALVIGTQRHQPVIVRGIALGAVAFLPQAALLAQARTAFVAAPLVGLALVAIGPGRLRLAAGLCFALVPLALTWDVHLRVYREAEDGPGFLETAMQPSARWMAATGAAAALVGVAWAVVDRRIELSWRATRVLEVAAVCAGIVAVGAVVVGVALAGPRERVDRAWHQFTSVTTDYEKDTRFESLGGGRYDFWRVAFDRWRDNPIGGIGADNFAVDYLRDRRTHENPKYPHSLEVGVLSQLGLVGILFFGIFAVTSGILAVPRRSGPPAARGLQAACLAAWLYWLVHASFDWFLELPAVSAPAFAFLGMSVALGAKQNVRRAARPVARIVLATTGVAAVAAVLALGAPWLAARHLENAIGRWSSDPTTTFELLERARALNPLSSDPDLYAGAIAARLGDRERMLRSFSRARERNPNSWYIRLELGLTYSVAGRKKAALREVRRALALNPREPVLHDVLAKLEAGKRISPRSLDAVFVERIVSRTT